MSQKCKGCYMPGEQGVAVARGKQDRLEAGRSGVSSEEEEASEVEWGIHELYWDRLVAGHASSAAHEGACTPIHARGCQVDPVLPMFSVPLVVCASPAAAPLVAA